MITSDQIRAGLALLRWSASKAAEHSNIGTATVQRARDGRSINRATAFLLKHAMEEHGVVFGDDGSVRLDR